MEKIDAGRSKKRREGLGAEHGDRCYPKGRLITILLVVNELGLWPTELEKRFPTFRLIFRSHSLMGRWVAGSKSQPLYKRRRRFSVSSLRLVSMGILITLFGSMGRLISWPKNDFMAIGHRRTRRKRGYDAW